MYFMDRKDAGRKLALALASYKKAPATTVVGLARGGVIVASEVAKVLQLPLDVIVPRKIGAPLQQELAIGAVAGSVVWLDKAIISSVGALPEYIEKTIEKERKEGERRLALFRKNLAPQDFKKRTVILVDDGIATGATMRASIAWVKENQAKRVIVAVPVAAEDSIASLQKEVDEVICLFSPIDFMAVGQFYEHFEQTEDAEVIACLK